MDSLGFSVHKLNSGDALLVLVCYGGEFLQGRDEIPHGSGKPVRDLGPDVPPRYRVPKGPKDLPLSPNP